MTLRVAVIGAGIMGSDHARIIAEDIPGAKLQIVCDVSEVAARRIADEFAAEQVGTDALAAIQRDDVDAVLIASPDETHAELTLAALKVHKPVLCEKPLSPSPLDCLKVIEAESALGRRLVQIGFMRRYDSAYTEVKHSLDSKQIGTAIMMHNFHRNVEAPAGFSGMMAITNSAPHEFDAIRYVLGAEITTVSAYEPGLDNQGACKPVLLVMETSSGQLVTVEVNNNAAYGYDVRGELIGDRGSVSFGGQTPVQLDKALSSSTSYAADWRPRFEDAYRRQNKAWIQSIINGNPDPIAATAWDGYCASVIAQTGAGALASGQRHKIELAKKPALYRE